MRVLKAMMVITLSLFMSSAAYSHEEPNHAKEQLSPPQEQAAPPRKMTASQFIRRAGSFFWLPIYGFRGSC
jgi:hypothetical protein